MATRTPKLNTNAPKAPSSPKLTLTIDNFGGRLTRYINGKVNSGFAKYSTTFGNDPFKYPNQLSWQETGTRIDPNATVITDLIMAQKERVESGISYVYAVGHTGRVYKIQVNNPSAYNPDYDNPVLLTTLTSNSPTFTRGGFIEFYGSTERMYIGHDKGLTQLNFDGTGETFVGVLGSWTQNVPRPLKQFVGNLYIGNGSNLAEMGTGLIINTYTKLDPGFPGNYQCRDLDISVEGTYLNAVVTRQALGDLTATTPDTSSSANLEAYLTRWNGSDKGVTSYTIYPSFDLTANLTFTNHQYVFGYDIAGMAVFNPTDKILSPLLTQAPLPNAVASNGNLMGWMSPEFYNGFLRGSTFIYGSLDNEVKPGWWRQFSQSATGTETDIVRIPSMLFASNFGLGSTTNGYPSGVFSTSKAYFSTLETSTAPTTKYKFYKWNPVATGAGTAIGGIYETQTELFTKKVMVSEYRIYGQPWVAGNAFTVDLIGSDGNPIPGSTKAFSVTGGSLTVGNDFAWFNCNSEPSFALGVRITQTGTTNSVISKIEIDYGIGGK